MAVTGTGTKYGPMTSIGTQIALSSASGSIDILTLLHGLGRTPDIVTPVLRTINTVVSTGVPGLVMVSKNITAVVLHMPTCDAGATNAQWDIVCQALHSLIK